MFGRKCVHINQRKLISKRTPELNWYLVECRECGKLNIQHIYGYRNRAWLTKRQVYPYRWFTKEKMPKLGEKLLTIYEIETGESI